MAREFYSSATIWRIDAKDGREACEAKAIGQRLASIETCVLNLATVMASLGRILLVWAAVSK